MTRGLKGEKGTVHDIEGPTQLSKIRRGARIEVTKSKLDNRWRINDTAISFSKTTGTGGDGLLANG